MADGLVKIMAQVKLLLGKIRFKGNWFGLLLT